MEPRETDVDSAALDNAWWILSPDDEHVSGTVSSTKEDTGISCSFPSDDDEEHPCLDSIHKDEDERIADDVVPTNNVVTGCILRSNKEMSSISEHLREDAISCEQLPPKEIVTSSAPATKDVGTWCSFLSHEEMPNISTLLQDVEISSDGLQSSDIPTTRAASPSKDITNSNADDLLKDSSIAPPVPPRKDIGTANVAPMSRDTVQSTVPRNIFGPVPDIPPRRFVPAIPSNEKKCVGKAPPIPPRKKITIVTDTTQSVVPTMSEDTQIKYHTARTLFEQGRYQQALSRYSEVVKNLEKSHGASHLETAISKHWVAATHFKLSNLNKSLEIYYEVLPMLEAILGAEHHDTLATKSNIAGILYLKGKVQNAVDMYAEVIIKAKTRILGPDGMTTKFSDIISAKHGLALLALHKKQYEKSYEMLMDVLTKEEELHGSKHPRTLLVKANLTLFYLYTGEYDKAVSNVEYVLRARQEVLPVHHPDIREASKMLDICRKVQFNLITIK